MSSPIESRRDGSWWRDFAFLHSARVAAAISAILVLLIVGFLIIESNEAVSEIGTSRFFTDPVWSPTATGADSGYLILPMLAGTLVVSFGAVLIAAPVGILASLFCRFYAPVRLGAFYQRTLELMGGMPSVVYGFWGLTVVVPLIARWQPPGTSVLAGILVLSLMLIPTMMIVCLSSLDSIPRDSLIAARSLGLSRMGMLRCVVIPHIRRTIGVGVVLQSGRAIGETMVVLMVCGNATRYPDGPFASARTLTANIALEMAYAMDVHRSSLFFTGAVLMLFVLILVVVHSVLSKESMR